MAHQLSVEGNKVIESDEKGQVVAEKSYNRVHAGYVAAVHNPRVSAEAKEAKKILHDLEAAHGDKPSDLHQSESHARGTKTTVATHHAETHEEEVHRHRQISGYKGTLKRDDVSDEARAHARDMLKQLGCDPSEYEE
ncbi:Con-6 family protein [Sporobolomyces koalae]|uniref:Con-6 family protein n=1 Tax=Sporobolomyces koalae TaxID=500713 RepID=UPI0031826C2D